MKQMRFLKAKEQQKKQQRQLPTEQRHTFQNKKKLRLAPYLFLTPSLIGVSIFVLIPFGDAVKRSFYEAMSGKFVGLDNYKTVIGNDAFNMAGSNTLKFIGTCIPILLIVSLLLAVFLNKVKFGGSFFKTSFLIPMAIPTASIVLLWKIFFHQNGIFNNFILFFGGTGSDWIFGEKSFYILIFSYLWKNTGYNMVLWLAGLGGISPSLYEAAQIDGAGSVKQFFYITLPSMLPTVFIISVLSLLNSFKVFREAYLVAGDYPNKKIYMLQHLFNNWFVSLDIQKMCAAAVIVAVFIFIIILILQKIWGNEERE